MLTLYILFTHVEAEVRNLCPVYFIFPTTLRLPSTTHRQFVLTEPPKWESMGLHKWQTLSAWNRCNKLCIHWVLSRFRAPMPFKTLS